jgi:DNA-binding transcriptional LysR family regulator
MTDICDRYLRSIGRRSNHFVPRWPYDCAGIPTTPGDLNRHDAVIYSGEGGGDTWAFRRDDSKITVKLVDRLRVSASEALRSAVCDGMGLAVVPRWMFEPELESGAIRAVLNDWSLPKMDLSLHLPAGRMTSTKVRVFEAFIEDVLRRHNFGEEAA